MTRQDTVELYDLLGKLNSPIHHIGGLDATSELLEMIHIDKNSNVLDVGCGSGYTACDIARKFECRVVGIDASTVMITKAQKRAAKKKLEDQVEFRVADIFDLPFNNESFDVAIFESVLNVLSGNRGKAMSEIIRVIRPEGQVGGNEPIVFSTAPPELLQEISEITPFLGSLLTPQQLKALFENSLQEVVIKEYPSSNITSKMVFRDTMKTMGFFGLLSYLSRMLYYSFKDSKLRRYSKYSRLVLKDKNTREHFGYAFIIGKKLT